MKLEIKNISYNTGDRLLLDNITANIPKGELVGLIGPNGAGKSTLLKNIYRVLHPNSGAIYLDGDDISTLKSKEAAKRMSVLHQEGHFGFDMRVLDLVLLGRYAHGEAFSKVSKEDIEIARNSLKKVNMSEYEERGFLSLSGGEKQRILLAKVLAQQTPFVILDEPTNHLDVGYQYEIMNILKNEDCTVFSSIHDLNIAAMYCDHILAIDGGKIIKWGTPEEILTEDFISKIFKVGVQISNNPKSGKLQIYYYPIETSCEKSSLL